MFDPSFLQPVSGLLLEPDFLLFDTVANSSDSGEIGNTMTLTDNHRKRKATTSVAWALSEIEEESFDFHWTLKNFSAFQGLEKIQSPIFKGGPKSNHSWQLSIMPKNSIEGTEYFSLFLYLISMGQKNTLTKNETTGQNLEEEKIEPAPVKARFQLDIVDSNGTVWKRSGDQTMAACDFMPGKKWGRNKFITIRELNNSLKSLTDDTLRIHCQVWIDGELKHITGTGGGHALSEKSARWETAEEAKSSKRLDELIKDMKALMGNPALSDVSVLTDSKSFPAHKNVLAARSSVFAAMFQSEMLESIQNIVKITDFEGDVVQAMLEYIYGGEPSASTMQKVAPDLLAIAEKYALLGLKDECENYIALNLTTENAAEVLSLAHTHSASKLHENVAQFITRNKKEVQMTEGFKKLAVDNPAVIIGLHFPTK